ncbi:MAG: DUF3558 family protein [Acidimicrobiales bacterium]|nr:DUF3558 family protein [Acidimicrobiales bacterium]
MRTRPLLPALVLAGVLALAACGSSEGSDASADASVDPGASSGDGSGGTGADADTCALVSTEEVADAIGEDVVESQALPTGCTWFVDPEIDASYEWQEVPDGFEANRDLGEQDDYEVEDITGLGDAAFVRTQLNLEGDPLLSEVWVQVGDAQFFVRSTLPSSDEVVAADEALAALLVDRVG